MDYYEYSDDKQYRLVVWETNKGWTLGLCKWQVQRAYPEFKRWATVDHYRHITSYDQALAEGQRALKVAIEERLEP